MNRLLTILSVLLVCETAYPQKAWELSHQVLVPAASVVATGTGISYQQTVGETAVEVTPQALYVLTQGFQQPRFIPKISLPPREGNGVDFFPNPVTEVQNHILKIRMYGVLGRSYFITITTLPGQAMYSENIELSPDHDYIHEVNMQAYANGVYIVRVVSADGVINRSFKVEKL